MWFTESHIVLVISFLLVVLLTHFILDIKWKACCYPVKQLNYFFIKISQLLLLAHSHRSRMRLLSLLDCYRLLFAVNVLSFKSLPVKPFLPIAKGS